MSEDKEILKAMGDIKQEIGKIQGKMDGIAGSCTKTERHLEKLNGHVDGLNIKTTKNAECIKGLHKNWKIFTGIFGIVITVLTAVVIRFFG